MKKNTVKQALAEGKLQLGMGSGQLRSPEISRILASAGFKWAFLDTEHGGFDLETIQDICSLSVLVGLSPIVRVADLQYSLIARALDCGAQGVIFPRVESPELLEKAISWTKFPPLGIRGYGLSLVNVDYEKLDFQQIIEHTPTFSRDFGTFGRVSLGSRSSLRRADEEELCREQSWKQRSNPVIRSDETRLEAQQRDVGDDIRLIDI